MEWMCGWVGVQISDRVGGEVCKSVMGWMYGWGGMQVSDGVDMWVGRWASQSDGVGRCTSQ